MWIWCVEHVNTIIAKSFVKIFIVFILFIDLPTSQPTSMPSQPSSVPTALPTSEHLLYRDSLFIPYIVNGSIIVAIIYAILIFWHYCISDRETSRDAHVLDAEEHAKRFFKRVILNRRNYYIQTDWVSKWIEALFDRHKIFSLFSYQNERGRSNIILKFTLIVQE